MVAAAVVGSAVVGGAVSTMASNKASKAQRQASDSASQAQLESARLADQTQRYFYDTTRRDNLPAIQAGNTARNQLAMLLGLDIPGFVSNGGGTYLSGAYTDMGGSSGGGNPYSLGNAELVDYSTGVPKPNAELYANSQPYRDAWDSYLQEHIARFGTGYTTASDPDSLNQILREKLAPQIAQENAEADAKSKARQYAESTAGAQQASQDIRNNPLFGSLNKQFTEQDFWNDPGTKLGFQFGLDQGTQGLNRQAAASGSLNSGAQLKALTRYATDYTGTKYGDAYNRDQAQKANQFNRLASLAGVGQQAVNSVGSAGANAANQIGSNSLYAGNAQANAAYASGNARANSAIGTANAINGALGFGANYLSNGGFGGFGSGASAGSGVFGTVSGMNGVSPVTGMNSGVGYAYSPYSSFGASFNG